MMLIPQTAPRPLSMRLSTIDWNTLPVCKIACVIQFTPTKIVQMAASQPMCRCQVDGWLHRQYRRQLRSWPARLFGTVLGAKRLELLRRLAPKATTIAVLVNPSLDAEGERRDVQAAAQEIGQQLIILDVNSDRDIETALQHSSNAGPMRCSSVPALS
jgi:hypothetical protein